MRSLLVATLLLLGTSPALAGWQLINDESTISFTTTKANVVAEVNDFQQLSGSLDEKGSATLEIALDSVDTAVETRDERMREFLFETKEYPVAQVRLSIDPAVISSLAPGETATLAADATLELHGTSNIFTVAMNVAKLTASRLLVTSEKPIIVNASQVGLLEGVDKLQELAGLASISPAVPVTFLLTFENR